MNEECSVWFKVVAENEQGVLVEGPYIVSRNAIDLNAGIEERFFLREWLKRRAEEFTSRSVFNFIMQEEPDASDHSQGGEPHASDHS